MTRHAIVHIEIPAEDRKASAQFYSQLFDWEIDNSMDEFNFTMFTAGDGPGGGFPNISDGFEAGQVLIYVATPDVDASLEQAEALGGKVVAPKTEIPGIGWFGIFQDPTGNSIGLYSGIDEQDG